MPQTSSMAKIMKRKYYRPLQNVLDLPNLIEIQTKSYDWFIKEGIKEVLDEISPIVDFSQTQYELYFGNYYLDDAKYPEKVAREKKANYEAPLKVEVTLKNLETGKSKTQEVFLCDLPIMTRQGTFVINGVERVIISQLLRSAGVFFTAEEASGNKYFGAKIIPGRGAWLELETASNGAIYAKIDRKRKIPVTTLLRAFGLKTNDDIKKAFSEVNTDKENDYIQSTLEKDPAETPEEAFVEIYKKIRPGDLATPENAKQLVEGMFFDFKKYDLSRVGRYRMNKVLGENIKNTKENRVLKREDFIEIVKEIIRRNVNQGLATDIDHLGNRRVRAVGELLQQRFRVGILRAERNIKDKMSTADSKTVTPSQLINIRPISSVVKEFFASSQLSQFMDQTNPLSELVNKRRLSALGPGGLSKERAGFDVRDVHRTHYGRICPNETPEGPNIGLVNYLASYARVNDYGFLETPYRKVIRLLPNDGKSSIGFILGETITGIAKKGDKITKTIASGLAKKKDLKEVKVKPTVTGEIVYMTADEEEHYIIAQANTEIDENGYFKNDLITARKEGEAAEVSVDEVSFMDVASVQTVSVASGLVPFLEHDDGKRTLMAANMQRQAVPLIRPEAPIVGTGIESKIAEDSGFTILAEGSGVVTAATGSQVIVKYDKGGEKIYDLEKYRRTNDDTCIDQRPVVESGQKIKKGDVLVDGPATDNGELSLGKNLLVAYMAFGGYNYEDAIIISERLVKEDVYSSVHLELFSCDVRDTKLGAEMVTRDIPNVGEEALRNLDEEGIVRIGAEVSQGDILVGKITPKGETELSAEERLLRAIFGEKARDVKDTSLRVQPGVYGKVVGINIRERDKGDELSAGVIKQIDVLIAKLVKITVGDKIAGRHGNKGVIARIAPVEDMPYLEDGTPVDIVLNPLGVSARMNIGQVLEAHLGFAARALGIKVAAPVFMGPKVDQIKAELKAAGLAEDGKSVLYDGRTGEPFDQRVTVGVTYMLKLHHMVDDKIHARSIGSYAMVTQQPLGGKAQFGGQRFGEMEVWALEAYGAAHTLQEILTIKSDDVLGRSKAYESIIKGDDIREPRVPESFNVLVKELQGLGLSIDLLEDAKKEKSATDAIEEGYEESISELDESSLIEGNAAATLPKIDIEKEAQIDEFEAIKEATDEE
ncbi:MAG: DNA-directed RNA polymerase subunit beta [Patescibacteria group bacterium]|nr:DNA-directed RNA polymerase subunit beta [Patescibacteria group bacterium]